MTLKALGWNQDVVLGAANKGKLIAYAEPGRSNSEDGLGRLCWTRKTIDSLVSAGYLAGSEANGFAITEQGRQAFASLPRRSN